MKHQHRLSTLITRKNSAIFSAFLAHSSLLSPLQMRDSASFLFFSIRDRAAAYTYVDEGRNQENVKCN